MNLFAWIAFGAIAGYTAWHLAPLDRSIGASGQVLIGSVGAMVGGLVGAVIAAVDPFGPQIEMVAVSTAVAGAVAAIVWREEHLRRQLANASARPRPTRRGGSAS